MNLYSPSTPLRPLGAVGYHIRIGRGERETAITFVEFALNIHEFLVDIKNKWRFRDNWGSWLVIVKKCFNTIKKSSKDCTYTLAKKGKLKFNSYVYGGGSQLKELKTAGTSCVPKSSFIRCKGDKIFNFLPQWAIRLLWYIKRNESH